MPSMRLNTTAVAPKTDESGWQVVGDPKSKPAKVPEPKKPKAVEAPAVAPAAAAVSKAPIYVGQFNEGSSAVLAEFDRQWAKQQNKARKNGASNNAFDALEVEERPPKVAKPPPTTSSPADSATDSPKQRVVRKAERAKPAKAKKEKPEKAPTAKKAAAPAVKKEVSVNSLAAEVDVDGFKEFMASLEAKHAADEVLQLQCVQDCLRSVFATQQLQFAAMLQSMSLQAVADRPWADLPGPLRQAISRFVGSKSSAALSSYLASACDVLVTGLPERGAGGPPAKVEVLVMVAAILRMRPAVALLPACDVLAKGGVRMLAPGRLPTTLWVLEQAARASGGQGVGSAVHAWCRVVLPAIVLAEVPSSLSTKKSSKADKVGGYQLEAESRATALKYVTALLASPSLQEAASAGLDTRQPDKPRDAVVPAAAIAEVSTVVHGETRRAGVLRDTPAALRAVEPALRSLAAATPVQHHVVALVSKCLEASESCSAEAINEHASMLLVLLLAHPSETAAAWSAKHKPHVVGSSNVLQHLAATRALLTPLLSSDHGRATLLELLSDISAKQATLAKSSKASTAREAARDAQGAIDALMAWNSVQAGGGSAMFSLLALVVGAVAVPILIDRNPELAREHLSGLLGGENTERVLSACKQLVSTCATELPSALKSLVSQGQDYIRQLIDAAKASK